MFFQKGRGCVFIWGTKGAWLKAFTTSTLQGWTVSACRGNSFQSQCHHTSHKPVLWPSQETCAPNACCVKICTLGADLVNHNCSFNEDKLYLYCVLHDKSREFWIIIIGSINISKGLHISIFHRSGFDVKWVTKKRVVFIASRTMQLQIKGWGTVSLALQIIHEKMDSGINQQFFFILPKSKKQILQLGYLTPGLW